MMDKTDLTLEEVIERFALIQGISLEEAKSLVGAVTVEGVLKNIQDFTINKIKTAEIKLNRKQRRALQKKHKTKNVPLCPHGRPIMLVYQQGKLESLFARRQ